MNSVKKWSLNVFDQKKKNEIESYLLNNAGSLSMITTAHVLSKHIDKDDSITLVGDDNTTIEIENNDDKIVFNL